MNNKTKLFAFAVSLLLLMPLLISCGESAGESSEPAVSSENDFFGYAIPEGAYYNGAKVGVLTTATSESATAYQVNPADNSLFSSENASATVTAEAECARLVEEKLGIEFEEEVIYTFSRYGGDMYQRIVADSMSMTADYLFCMPCLIEGAMLATDGLLWEMSDVIQLANPWWCQPFNEALTVDGSCFMAAGDIGTVGRDASLFVAFNKKMAESNHITESYGYSSLYEMVDAKKWTQDVMYEMAKSVYQDLNNNNTCDIGDINGLSGQAGMVYWLLRTGGESICETDETGYPRLTVMNERAIGLIEKAQDYLQDPKSGFICADDYFNVSSVPVSDVIVPEFKADRCLFFFNALMNLDLIRDMESDFGVVPCPLYDSTQDEYVSNVGAWSATAICVPISTSESDIKMTGAVLEALGAVSRSKLTPVYYEQTLQYQITRDDESMRMLDIIFANRTPDLAETFRWGKMQSVITGMLTAPKGSFVSAYEAAEQATNLDIEGTVDAFREKKNR